MDNSINLYTGNIEFSLCVDSVCEPYTLLYVNCNAFAMDAANPVTDPSGLPPTPSGQTSYFDLIVSDLVITDYTLHYLNEDSNCGDISTSVLTYINDGTLYNSPHITLASNVITFDGNARTSIGYCKVIEIHFDA